MLTRVVCAALILLVSLSPVAQEKAESQYRIQQHFDCYWGYGHGGSFSIVRFQENKDRTFTVLYVYFSNGGYKKLKPRSKWKNDAYILKTEKAVISSAVFEKAKEILLKGLKDSEERPQTVDTDWMSTSDFLAGLSLYEGGISSEKIWCGYRRKSKEPFYKPLLSSCIEIEKLSKTFEWKGADTAETGSFISDVLISQSPKFKRLSWWWPKERLVQMSGIKGNTRAIPVLISLIRTAKAGGRSDAQSVTDRNLGYLVTALDCITGRNLRFDSKGEPRPLPDVVADYVKLYGSAGAAVQ
jgi:hypothetical protein